MAIKPTCHHINIVLLNTSLKDVCRQATFKCLAEIELA